MRGQAHTLMGYLVWAVFFVILAGVVYTVYRNSVLTSVPTPIESISDTIASAVRAGEVGNSEKVCTEVYPAGEIYISKSFIEKHIHYGGNVDFRCGGNGCEVSGEAMVIREKRGLLCAYMENGTLVVEWR